MKSIIYCEVPTNYQYTSLVTLMGHAKVHNNNAPAPKWSALYFENKKEAKKWIMERKYELYDDRNDRINHGRGDNTGLEYDAATCYIMPLSEFLERHSSISDKDIPIYSGSQI